MTAVNRSIIAASVLALAAYWLCLRFIFPGYFAPLAPHHTDLYLPAGLTGQHWLSMLGYPRPVLFVVLEAIGLLGVQGSIAAVIAFVIAGAVLTVVMVQRWMGHPCAILSIACYITVLFSHPEFYFQHRHDVPAALSYIFLLLAVEYWRQWLESSRASKLAACSVYIALLGLTKETYVASLAVLLLGFLLLKGGIQIRKLLLPALCIGLATAGPVFVNFVRYRQAVTGGSDVQDSYHVGLTPRSVWLGETFYLGHLMNWAALLLVLAAILFVCRNRRRLTLSILLVTAGVFSLLPNSLLPNHAFEEYAWAAAPLVFAPLLLVAGWVFTLASVGLVALWIGSNRQEYHLGDRDWNLEQEHQNARILASLPALKRIGPGARRVLISGIHTPFSPWGDRGYVKEHLGPHEWTWLIRRDQPVRSSPPVNQALGRDVSLSQFDYALLYDDNGNLVGQLSAADLRKAEQSDPEGVFIPESRALKAELKQNPNDFGLLLKAGMLYLDWGWPKQAEPYLQRAAEATKGANPYPYYFLGLCSEDLKDNAAAKADYELAIKADSPPGNPFFKPALARVSGP